MSNFSKTMELIAGLEPATSSLPRKCSTSEPYEPKLRQREIATQYPTMRPKFRLRKHIKAVKSLQLPVNLNGGAGNGARTRDPQLGRLML